RLVKSREVGADAGGVDAKIAAPMARRGAHVDATSRVRLGVGDPDDDVVGEAHPKALLARLDAACRGIDLDDRPTHLLCCRERNRERRKNGLMHRGMLTFDKPTHFSGSTE